MKRYLCIFASFLALIACSEKQTEEAPLPETLVAQYDEAEMDAAIETARSRVDDFLGILAENGADSFSVKAPIKDGDQTEHFWIVDVSYENGVFSGEIGNEPGIVTNVEASQKWKIRKEEISDWMYTIGEKIHGGFTIDPLLETFPKEYADDMRARLVR